MTSRYIHEDCQTLLPVALESDWKTLIEQHNFPSRKSVVT
jgi:hypothetical protein